MMKKVLWALALLFIASGCDDNGKDPASLRPDNRVTTTFNFEYNLNYATETTSPASYAQAPVMPSDKVAFRVVVDLYEIIEVPSEPDPIIEYRFYDRKIFSAEKHELGSDGNLVISGEVKLDKIKYKAVVWADYTLKTTPSVDRNFFTTNEIYESDENKGLKYITDSYPGVDNSSYINEGALRGVKEFDLTIYEDVAISSETVDVTLDRVIGGVYLVANDLAAYKALAESDAEYDEKFRPVRAMMSFGAYNADTAPNAGYPSIYNAFDNEVILAAMAGDVVKRYDIGAPMSDEKQVIANFFAFTDAVKNKQDLNIKIYGPLGGLLIDFDIADVPSEPNTLLYVEGPFLTGEGNPVGDYSIRVVDKYRDGDIDWEFVETPEVP